MTPIGTLIDVDAVTLTPNLGELCPGQLVVLTCSTTDGDSMNWFYNGISLDVGGFIPSDPIRTTRDVMVSGFMFFLEFTSSMPEFASTLSFRADAAMNGHNVSCRVAIPLSGGGGDIQEATQTLQITQIGRKRPVEILTIDTHVLASLVPEGPGYEASTSHVPSLT